MQSVLIITVVFMVALAVLQLHNKYFNSQDGREEATLFDSSSAIVD